ncbi:alpha-L-fucosidase [Sphingobacterium spiritivorum]|uniref:alpha-L-fucosidase n=1 Tax=Sphingobacterium spiritivorum TaxID=258 RepID=UPI003DA43B7C
MKKLLLILSILMSLSMSSFAQLTPEKRTEWFKEDRFGMFIHWGLYSAAEGLWKGEKLRYVK